MALKNRDGFKVPPLVPPNVNWFPPSVRRRGSVIAWLAKRHGWKAGAELGLWEGATIANVLQECPAMTMIGVDLWEPQPDNPGPEGYEGWDHNQHKRTCIGRLNKFPGRWVVIQDYTTEAAKQVADGSLDFVFIDADHSEEGCRSDIEAWAPKLNAGGWLLGHDINWPGVRAAVDDLVPGYWIGPDVVWGRQWRLP